jgi:hypothetical protein
MKTPTLSRRPPEAPRKSPPVAPEDGRRHGGGAPLKTNHNTDAVFQAIAGGESAPDISILMNKAAEALAWSERRKFRGRVLGALENRESSR